MLSIEPTVPPLIGLSIRDEVTQKEIDETVELIRKKVEQKAPFRLYAKVYNFGAWNGLLNLCKVLEAQLESDTQFEKFAVITPQTWLINVKGLAEHLGKSTHLKFFAPIENVDAMMWLERDEPEPKLALEKLDLSTRKIIGYRINRPLNRIEYQQLSEKFDRRIQKVKDLLVLVEIGDMQEDEFRKVLLDLNSATRYYKTFGKIAMVLPTMSGIDFINVFVKETIQVKVFTQEDKEAAWTWLKEGKP